MPSVLAEEEHRMPGIDRRQHNGISDEPHDAEDRQHHEPHDHDRTEHPPDAIGAMPLDGEDPDQDHHGNGHDVRVEQRRRDLQPLDCAEDGNGRRDDAVAVQEARPENPQEDQRRPPEALARGQQRGQREDAAFALIVGAHHDGDVLDRDHQQQRIDDQRQHTQHVLLRGRDGVRSEEALAQRVQRTGADVAVDDADRCQGERSDFLRTWGRARQNALSYTAEGACPLTDGLSGGEWKARNGPATHR